MTGIHCDACELVHSGLYPFLSPNQGRSEEMVARNAQNEDGFPPQMTTSRLSPSRRERLSREEVRLYWPHNAQVFDNWPDVGVGKSLCREQVGFPKGRHFNF